MSSLGKEFFTTLAKNDSLYLYDHKISPIAFKRTLAKLKLMYLADF